MAEENGEEEDGGKKGGKLKLIIIAVAGLLVLGGGGGAAAYFLGLFGGSQEAAEAHAGEDAAHGEEVAADAHGEAKADEGGGHGKAAAEGHGAPAEGGAEAGVVFVDMPDVLVNLQSNSSRMRFLKLRVALETENTSVAQKVQALTPRIMDSFQMYLRALTIDEIKGSTGMQKLKEELMARINHAVAPERIDDLLVKEMLVQ
ncbi:MAG: flagellar basal body-associated FliL family protein [Geminicoccaceae bacterium]|nr:flagellar basal body-associated FliL family protein [Geminicoccaceae bacterium]